MSRYGIPDVFVPQPCKVCGEPLAVGPFEGFRDAANRFWTIHTRCGDWTGRRCPATHFLEAMERVWPRLLAATKAQALPGCQRLREIERAWPPEPFTGEAAEAVVSEVIGLRMALWSALQHDPKAKGTLRVLC